MDVETATIDDLGMSNRTANCLKAENIYYLHDLLKKEHYEILRTPNLGKQSLAEIETNLAYHGFQLKNSRFKLPPLDKVKIGKSEKITITIDIPDSIINLIKGLAKRG